MLRAMSGPSVVTVGNFDGVHLGHQALLRQARALARAQGGAAVVAIAFEEHPLATLNPPQAPPRLTDRHQRLAALTAAGADRVEWLSPDPATLSLTPEQFVRQVAQRSTPVGWVEGADFRFGRGRAGDIQTLRQLGGELGFDVMTVDPVQVVLRDKSLCTVSSSLVRWLVGQGRVADAAICLGRPYALRGQVVRGEGRGRTIGFPTANLDLAGRQLPCDGVYGGEVELDGRKYAAAISVGTKPTFGPRERTFEALILEFEADLYGRDLEVRVLRWIRDQWAFPSAAALMRRMTRDLQEATAR